MYSNSRSPWKQSKLVWSSFRYFYRSHIAVVLGIAAATAVIIGALVVGDSVRGSLRGLVLSRLANIELLMQTRNFFRTELVAEIAEQLRSTDSTIVPLVILSNSSVEYQFESRTRRASHVQVLGIDQSFVDALDDSNRQLMSTTPGPDEVSINESLASELGVNVGDQISLLLSNTAGVPADNPLGRRDEVSRILPRQKVVAILKERSIGDVRFQTSQEAPFNVFANLKTIQEFLDVDGKVNSALVFSNSPIDAPSRKVFSFAEELSRKLKPSLEDYGLQLHRHQRVFPDQELGETSDDEPVTVYDYYQLSSKELLIDYGTESAVVKALGPSQCIRLLAYLANSIQKGNSSSIDDSDLIPELGNQRRSRVSSFVKSKTPILNTQGRKVPYSIIVGVDKGSALEMPALDSDESNRVPIGLVNSWLASELDLNKGDRLQLEFYEPETVDGRPVKAYTGMKVAGLVKTTEPVSPYRRKSLSKFDSLPSFANDTNLTPSVPGITDQESISNWDVPFELELRDLILKQDDKYWENHRLAPKIFIPLVYARQMFGSRFGGVTSIRIPAKNVLDEASLRETLEQGILSNSNQLGFAFAPIRQQQFRAASGATPFDLLFLSLSFFVIVAALLLVAILFRLAVQQRTTQLGVLVAQGFSSTKVQAILLQEFLIVAVLGALIGIPLGLAYAKMMIAGLESWWIGAISTRFLDFSFSVKSVLLGLIVGIGSSMLTIYLSLRRVSKLTPLSLLRGQEGDMAAPKKPSRVGWTPSIVGVIVAVLLALFAFGQTGMARAGCFFGSGMLLLLSSWLGIRQLLLYRTGRPWMSQYSLIALSIRAIRRNPLRSSLSIGLLAVASFLIASMGVFRMSPTRAGYGGFDLIGVSTQPIYDNMGSPAARREAIGPAADPLSSTIVIPMRMREGDDASCTNLFQASQPTILGLSNSLQSLTDSVKGYEFSWASSSNPESPWDELQFGDGTPDNPIPVILDQNTAMWSLKQGGSLNSNIELVIDGERVVFRVVGLLFNSVLQGKLLISERSFQNLFPKISGYRFFLINSGNRVDQDQAATVLEDGWNASGLDVISSEELLERLLNVQNTYISAFQALGALGLLLGTIGLIAVQLRSVLERRRELALMQAVGFSKLRIGNLLTLETIVLLGLGFFVGVCCAALALIPYVVEVGPQLSVLQPLLMLVLVFVCGLVSALLAIVVALKIPLLASLKTE